MTTDQETVEEINKFLNGPIEIVIATPEYNKNLEKTLKKIISSTKKIQHRVKIEEREFDEVVNFVNAEGIGPETRRAVVDEKGMVIRLYLNTLKISRNIEKDRIFKLISRLSYLKFIFIYNLPNVLEIPKEITKLINLEVLALFQCKSSRIPREIIELPKLRVLHLSVDNINIPREIASQGLNAIKNYFTSLDEASEISFLYEAKLVFVGRGFAGKTSLIKKLTIPDYRLEKNIKSTEGIDIKFWDVKIPLEKSNVFRFNIWDFGGQEKYDATHQFFITERTLYIFVTEARQESNFLDFDYWLNVVQILGNDSPVIVVQNKIDIRKRNLPTDRYVQQFPNILAFVDVSCSDNYEHTIKNLIDEIKSAINSLPQVGDALPKEWVDIRKELKKRRTDHISYDDYVALCRKYGLSSEKADFLSRYYHDLGVIVHYSKDPLLKNMVIINPDWAVDGAYTVLDTRNIEENKGRFDNKDLEQIWDQPKYRKKHAELLALMKNYELCFELGATGMYIAPELLSANPGEFTPIRQQDKLTFMYQYKFMPAGIMTRFIVKIHRLIEQDNFWKHGAIVVFEDARALVTEDEINRQIRIELEGGKNKKELLAIIRKEFYEINTGFKRKIQFDELIPCNCTECKNSESPHFFKWETLRKYDQKDVDKIRCDISLIEINVKELMGEIAEKSEWTLEETIVASHLENTAELDREIANLSNHNNFAPLIIGLSWWGSLALTIALFAFTQFDRFYLILFVIAFVITFPIIIAFTLVDKKSLSEENFITILKMSFSKIPGLKWLSK